MTTRIRALVVDDVRTMRFEAVYARTVASALELIKTCEIDELWLDHDLGPKEDVRKLVHWIEEQCFNNNAPKIRLVFVHTANPVGAAEIIMALQRYYRVMQVDAARITV